MERPSTRVTPWRLRDRLRAVPGGNLAVHAGVFVLGLGCMILGLVLIVLPGPWTIPPILLGLFVWSLEFAFAERLFARARASGTTAWTAAREQPWRTALAGAAGLLLLVAVTLSLSHYGVSALIDRARDVVS